MSDHISPPVASVGPHLSKLIAEHGERQIIKWVEARVHTYALAKTPDKKKRAVDLAKHRRIEKQKELEMYKKRLAELEAERKPKRIREVPIDHDTHEPVIDRNQREEIEA